MTPVEMHLEPFDNQREFVSESFGQNASMPLRVDYFDPKGLDSSIDDLLSLRQRILVHDSTPTKKLLQD